MAFKVTRTNASSDARIVRLRAEVHTREGSRVYVSNFLSEKNTGGPLFGTNPTEFQATQRERDFREWLLTDTFGTNTYKEFAGWVLDKLIRDGLRSRSARSRGSRVRVAGRPHPGDGFDNLGVTCTGICCRGRGRL
jgi:hypothetical protein